MSESDSDLFYDIDVTDVQTMYETFFLHFEIQSLWFSESNDSIFSSMILQTDWPKLTHSSATTLKGLDVNHSFIETANGSSDVFLNISRFRISELDAFALEKQNI